MSVGVGVVNKALAGPPTLLFSVDQFTFAAGASMRRLSVRKSLD